MITAWIKRHYSPSRLLISAAGAVDHQALAKLLNKHLGPLSTENASRDLSPPPSRSGLWVKRRRLEQAHLVVGSDFPQAGDGRRYAASVLNLVLGGNMSSRLFQEIRERRGLAYSVYSGCTAYAGAGMLEIYAASAPDKLPEVYGLILKELDLLGRTPLSRAELREAAGALKTALILGGESTESRMSRLAKNEMVFGRQISLEDSCRALDQVEPGEIQDLARTFWADGSLAVYALGPIKKKDMEACR